MKRTIANIILAAITLGGVGYAVDCTTWVQTCASCHRLAGCVDQCGNEPSYLGWSFCGSVDFVEGCTRTDKRVMVCPNCLGDPQTKGWDYSTKCILGWTCTSGQDCF